MMELPKRHATSLPKESRAAGSRPSGRRGGSRPKRRRELPVASESQPETG
jgi:hypothetical protein